MLTFALLKGMHHPELYVICDSGHDINLEPISVAEGDASDSESEENME